MSASSEASPLDISIAGLGNVGRALLGILASDSEASRRFRVVLLGDSSGALAEPAGFPAPRLAELAEAKRRGGSLAGEAGAEPGEGAFILAMRRLQPRIHVELGPTDPETGGPSLGRILAALELGAFAASASKGPFAAAWDRLAAAAGGEEAFWRRLRFSATVGAGLPLIDAGRALAAGSPIRGLAAALNGTSSLVLSLMEEGLSLEAAVGRAQELGMAEADPSADLDGLDAAVKLAILSRAVLGEALPLSRIARESVRLASPERLARAAAAGTRLRAIGRLSRLPGGGVEAAVRLEELLPSSPLAAAGGSAALVYDCERSGEVAISGRGAGPLETASAVYRDLVSLAAAGASDRG